MRFPAQPPGLDAPLPALEHPLCLQHSPLPGRPFALTGRRAAVTGLQAGDIGEVRFGAVRALSALGVEDAAVTAFRITALGVERRRTCHGHRIDERVFVPAAVPAVLLEWTAAAPVEIAVSWSAGMKQAGEFVARPGESVPRPGDTDGSGRMAWLRAGSGMPAALLILGRAPGEWHVEGARTRIVARLGPAAPLRMAIVDAGDGDAELEATLRALRDPEMLVRARAAAAARLRNERLAVAADDPAVALALEWALHRLDTAAASPATALGLLPAGDFESAASGLRALGGPADADVVTAALHLLLAARHFAWSGDLDLLSGEWERLRQSLRTCVHAGSLPRSARRSPAPEAAGADRLPHLLARAFREFAVAAESVGDAAAETVARSEAERYAPLDAGPVVLGYAAPAGQPLDHAPADAIHVAALVYGMLGAEPDAIRHRLRLQPRFPAAWTRATVARLRVGDAELRLDFERDGRRHRFRIAQETGAVPLRLILEPLLPGRRLDAAAVDGRPAELAARPAGERLRVPLQIVLDHERTVDLHVAIHEDAALAT